MSEKPFPPEMSRALDSFAPLPLPPGFVDRVVEKSQQRAAEPARALPRLPRRLRSANPWRRAGWIVGGLASVSLVSAAAAATGIFGVPVHVPVISQIAQSLEIVPVPVERAAPDAADASETVEQANPAPAVSVRERLDAVLDDPEFRALPRPQRRAELRQAARELVDSGEATPREVFTALRETARERIEQMPPEQREQIEEAVAERREARLEARREVIAAPPAERRQVRRQLVRERLTELRDRRTERLQQELEAGEPPAATAPDEEGVPFGEGSGEVVR